MKKISNFWSNNGTQCCKRNVDKNSKNLDRNKCSVYYKLKVAIVRKGISYWLNLLPFVYKPLQDTEEMSGEKVLALTQRTLLLPTLS